LPPLNLVLLPTSTNKQVSAQPQTGKTQVAAHVAIIAASR
jgi:hypothetical protein